MRQPAEDEDGKRQDDDDDSDDDSSAESDNEEDTSSQLRGIAESEVSRPVLEMKRCLTLLCPEAMTNCTNYCTVLMSTIYLPVPHGATVLYLYLLSLLVYLPSHLSTQKLHCMAVRYIYVRRNIRS